MWSTILIGKPCGSICSISNAHCLVFKISTPQKNHEGGHQFFPYSSWHNYTITVSSCKMYIKIGSLDSPSMPGQISRTNIPPSQPASQSGRTGSTISVSGPSTDNNLSSLQSETLSNWLAFHRHDKLFDSVGKSAQKVFGIKNQILFIVKINMSKVIHMYSLCQKNWTLKPPGSL